MSLLSPNDTIECLELAKKNISRMAWALALHVPNGISGGAGTVEREADNINGWIDSAIERIRADSR